MQNDATIWIEQINSHGHNWSIDVSRSPALGRISHHVVEPGLPELAVCVKAGCLIRPIPVIEGIDPWSAVGIAGISVAMRRYSFRSGMRLQKMVGWKLVGILGFFALHSLTGSANSQSNGLMPVLNNRMRVA